MTDVVALRRFRKKPVVIEAVQFDGTEEHAIALGLSVLRDVDYRAYTIPTLEGRMKVRAGDWIITGVKGERYPCKPDIFEATYEEVTDG